MTGTAEKDQIDKYLLGELPEDEMERFEERLFSDDDAFLELQSAEMALIDSYTRNEMSADHRRRFESNYLVTPERQAKVAEARAFHNELSELAPVAVATRERPGWFERLFGGLSIRMPAMQYAGAALVLLLALSTSWLIYDRGQTRKELLIAKNSETELNERLTRREQELNERLAEQRGEDSESLSALQNEVDSLRQQLDESRRKPPPGNAATPSYHTPLIATVFLSAGRGGGGAIPTIQISKDTKILNVKVPLSADETGKFGVEVTGPAGMILKRSGVVPTGGAEKVLNLSIPATKLEAGKYEVAMRDEKGVTKTRSFLIVVK